MRALLRKAGEQLIRRRFATLHDLTAALYASLVDYLDHQALIQNRPFDECLCHGAALDDIDPQSVADFLRRARHERQFPLPDVTPTSNALTHLRLLDGQRLTNAAMLLFGRDPQRFVSSAEVRCMHFHGTEIQRPAPSHQVFQGRLFEQVDRAVDFVLSVLNRSVGTRALSTQAPVAYEIPPDVVREAIVNAVAHRDYASAAAVQVSVFADRVEVWNPGTLPPPLTPERLREPHSSMSRNARICEALFLARYIEKYGTGTLMMIRESIAHALPEPDFQQRGGEFVATVWRDWLGAKGSPRAHGSSARTQKLAKNQPNRPSTAGVTGSPAPGATGTKLALSGHQVEVLVKCREDAALLDLMALTQRSDRTKFRSQVLKPLLAEGLIEMTIPDKPTSRLQRYRLTAKGRRWLAAEEP